jgi:rubrerythrin
VLTLREQTPPRPARFELRCAACGYGIVVRIAPSRCPMCKGKAWEFAARPRQADA